MLLISLLIGLGYGLTLLLLLHLLNRSQRPRKNCADYERKGGFINDPQNGKAS